MSRPGTRREPGLASQVLNTPVGELARGRIGASDGDEGNGRPATPRSVEAVLREADLPQSLAAVITRVVKRTGLWKSERADVAHELAAHFRDGLDAGRTPDDLVRDFGSPQVAAALIRRAKRRNRHLIWRLRSALVTAMGWFILALLGVYTFLFVRYLLVRPTIARNYAAEMNAQILAVPERDRAWPPIREAYLSLTPMSDGSPESFELPGEGAPVRLIDAMGSWDVPEEMLPAARAYLEASAPALHSIREAAARPALGLPLTNVADLEVIRHSQRLGHIPAHDTTNYNTTPDPNPWLVSTHSSELPVLRSMARLLATDTRLAAEDGDGERAVSNLVTMLDLARHARSRGFLIGDLVGLAIESLTLLTIDHLVTDRPDLLADEQMTELAHAVGVLGADGGLIRFDGERTGFDDTLQRLYSDDGNGNGVLTREGLRSMQQWSLDAGVAPGQLAQDDGLNLALGPIAAAVTADRASTRAEYNRFIDMIEAKAARPLWEQIHMPSVDVAIETLYQDSLARARYPVVAIMVPALDSAALNAERFLQHRDVTLTLIALEMHRRRAGAYPATLSDIPATLLPITPRDRLTGQILGYALDDGRPVLYSRGADTDDDGGRPIPGGDTGAASTWTPARLSGNANYINALRHGRGGDPEWDGDWILWPPEGSD